MTNPEKRITAITFSVFITLLSSAVSVWAVEPATQQHSPQTDESVQEEEPSIRTLMGFARFKADPKNVALAKLLLNFNKSAKTETDCLEFFTKMADMEASMFDLIRVKRDILQHSIDHPGLQKQFFGDIFPEFGSTVEKPLLEFRRKVTMDGIQHVLQQFKGRIPGGTIWLAEIGKWATQDSRAMTFSGDIDFSFVSNDMALTAEMKRVFEAYIKKVTGLTTIALDSVCTAHGRAGPEVYITHAGQAYGQDAMEKGLLKQIFLDEGRLAAQPSAGDLAILAMSLEASGVGSKGVIIDPGYSKEPGLSMEMVRHFNHDIARSGLFDVVDSILKACKYVDRSMAERKGPVSDLRVDAGLSEFARKITEAAQKTPNWVAIADAIKSYFGNGLTYTISSAGGRPVAKLVLNQKKIQDFFHDCNSLMWDNVMVGMQSRLDEINKRGEELRRRGQDVLPAEKKAFWDSLLEIKDVVEAEMEVMRNDGIEFPKDFTDVHAKLTAAIDAWCEHFKMKKISGDQLEQKKFIEEMIRTGKPTPRGMAMAFIMDNTVKAIETGNTYLDFMDDWLLGELRGQNQDFDQFILEARKIEGEIARSGGKKTTIQEISILKSRAASAIRSANVQANAILNATSTRRGLMKGFMGVNLGMEMKAYYDAWNREGFSGLSTEYFRRRLPGLAATEAIYVHGNYGRACIEIAYSLFPPAALPEGLGGMAVALYDVSYKSWWSSELALFTDSLYEWAVFCETTGKLEYLRYEGRPYFRADLERGASDFFKDPAFSKILENSLAETDEFLTLWAELHQRGDIGYRVRENFKEKFVARWEVVRREYVKRMIVQLEQRKASEKAIETGEIDGLFTELQVTARKLRIEEALFKAMDSTWDSNNQKAFWTWIVNGKRTVLAQPPTETERTRAATVVRTHLDAYREVLRCREAAESKVGALFEQAGLRDTLPAWDGEGLRWLSGIQMLSCDPEKDRRDAQVWREKANNGDTEALARLGQELARVVPDAVRNPDYDRGMAVQLMYAVLWADAYKTARHIPPASKFSGLSKHQEQQKKIIADFIQFYREAHRPVTVCVLQLAEGKRTDTPINTAIVRAIAVDEPGREFRFKLDPQRPGYYTAVGMKPGEYQAIVSAEDFQSEQGLAEEAVRLSVAPGTEVPRPVSVWLVPAPGSGPMTIVIEVSPESRRISNASDKPNVAVLTAHVTGQPDSGKFFMEWVSGNEELAKGEDKMDVRYLGQGRAVGTYRITLFVRDAQGRIAQEEVSLDVIGEDDIALAFNDYPSVMAPDTPLNVELVKPDDLAAGIASGSYTCEWHLLQGEKIIQSQRPSGLSGDRQWGDKTVVKVLAGQTIHLRVIVTDRYGRRTEALTEPISIQADEEDPSRARVRIEGPAEVEFGQTATVHAIVEGVDETIRSGLRYIWCGQDAGSSSSASFTPDSAAVPESDTGIVTWATYTYTVEVYATVDGQEVLIGKDEHVVRAIQPRSILVAPAEVRRGDIFDAKVVVAANLAPHVAKYRWSGAQLLDAQDRYTPDQETSTASARLQIVGSDHVVQGLWIEGATEADEVVRSRPQASLSSLTVHLLDAKGNVLDRADAVVRAKPTGIRANSGGQQLRLRSRNEDGRGWHYQLTGPATDWFSLAVFVQPVSSVVGDLHSGRPIEPQIQSLFESKGYQQVLRGDRSADFTLFAGTKTEKWTGGEVSQRDAFSGYALKGGVLVTVSAHADNRATAAMSSAMAILRSLRFSDEGLPPAKPAMLAMALDLTQPGVARVGETLTATANWREAAQECQYHWHGTDSARFADFETGQPRNSITFLRPGKATVWVSAVRKEGAVYVTLAESDPLDIEVVTGEVSLSIQPMPPLVGQEVEVTATLLGGKMAEGIEFNWAIEGEVRKNRPGDKPGVYIFEPTSSEPVRVRVAVGESAAKDEVGTAEIVVQANLYNVTISEPKPIGRVPQVYDPKLGKLVDVPQAVGVGQRAEVEATIEPTPEARELRYEWSATPGDGLSKFTLPLGREGTIHPSQAGTYTLTVIVRDQDNVVLGTGTRQITVVAPDEGIGPSKAKMDEARKAWAAGEIDRAVGLADEAAQLNTKEAALRDEAARMRRDRDAIKTAVRDGETLLGRKKLADAEKKADEALTLNGKYPPSLALRDKIAQAKKNLAEAWQREVQKAENQYNAGDVSDAQSTLAPVLKDLQQHPGVAEPDLTRQAQDLQKKIETAIAHLKRVEAKVDEIKSLLTQKKVPTAIRTQAELLTMTGSLPGNAGTRILNEVMTRIVNVERDYKAFIGKKDEAYQTAAGQLDWKAARQAAEEKREWELFPADEDRLKESVAFADRKIKEQDDAVRMADEAEQQAASGEPAYFLSGRLEPAIVDLKSKKGLFGAGDPRRTRFDQAVAKLENRKQAELHWREGEDAIARDKPVEAENPYAQSVALHPDASRRRILENLVDANRLWKQGREEYERVKTNPDLYETAPLERVISLCEESVRRLPSRARQDALDQLRAVLKERQELARRKKLADELWTQARALFDKHDLTGAQPKCEESVRVDPDPSPLRRNFTETIGRANRLWTQARKLFDEKKLPETLAAAKESIGIHSTPNRLKFVRDLEQARDGADKLKTEGEQAEKGGAISDLEHAIAKYTDSLRLWPNPALTARIAKLQADIERMKRAASRPNLSGKWESHQKGRKVVDCEIEQDGEQLTFIIRNRTPESRSPGRFIDDTTVLAEDWKSQASLQGNNRRLVWGTHSEWVRPGVKPEGPGAPDHKTPDIDPEPHPKTPEWVRKVTTADFVGRYTITDPVRTSAAYRADAVLNANGVGVAREAGSTVTPLEKNLWDTPEGYTNIAWQFKPDQNLFVFSWRTRPDRQTWGLFEGRISGTSAADFTLTGRWSNGNPGQLRFRRVEQSPNVTGGSKKEDGGAGTPAPGTGGATPGGGGSTPSAGGGGAKPEIKTEQAFVNLSGEKWNWFDPKADASHSISNDSITIKAPNHNDLWPATNFDAPRLTKRVSGNFSVKARVRGTWRENYNGAGLAVYSDRNSVVRLERGVEGVFRGHHITIFGFLKGQEIGRAYIAFPSADVRLRLERTGNRFTGYASADGTQWTTVGTIEAQLPEAVEAGLVLVNQYNGNIFQATFSEFQIANVTAGTSPTPPQPPPPGPGTTKPETGSKPPKPPEPPKPLQPPPPAGAFTLAGAWKMAAADLDDIGLDARMEFKTDGTYVMRMASGRGGADEVMLLGRWELKGEDLTLRPRQAQQRKDGGPFSVVPDMEMDVMRGKIVQRDGNRGFTAVFTDEDGDKSEVRFTR
jgi:regulation of enolase protein 1 (concanavalin A-like superfamily)